MGFVVLFATPVLMIASLFLRAVVAGWQSEDLAARMTEEGGAMPRLAAWTLTIQLAVLGLAWAMFQGTWQLAAWTAFKPLTVGFAHPALAVATLLVIVALSLPAAMLFAAIARGFDRRWQRRGWRTLLRPAIIFTGAALTTIAISYVMWRWLVRPRVGPPDLGFYAPPVAGLVATWLMHAVWNRLARTRLVIGTSVLGIAVAAMVLAILTSSLRSHRVLSVWGKRTFAGFAIDRVFDLDRVRDRMSLVPFTPVPRPGAEHPDIVLVTIDSLRSDHTPPYGGTAAMPVLLALGQRGSVFNFAFAPSNAAWRTVPSIAIGTAPHRVRERVDGTALRADPRHIFLAERLRAAGYETAGYVCCSELWGEHGRTGLHRGFERMMIDPEGIKLAFAAKTFVKQRSTKRPLFLWLHIVEPRHWNEKADARNDAERAQRYDEALTRTDKILAELLAGFAERPPDRAPVVIVTGTHGEPLGDHGQVRLGTDLYNSQIRVPLVLLGPPIKAQRIQETVSITDLAPTILELAGFVPPSGGSIDGSSFADLALGDRISTIDGGLAYADMIKDRNTPNASSAIVRGRWKLIETGTNYELYDLHSDPDERSNNVSVRLEILVQLRRMLDERRGAKQSPFD